MVGALKAKQLVQGGGQAVEELGETITGIQGQSFSV